MKNIFILIALVAITLASCTKKEISYNAITNSVWSVTEFESNNEIVSLEGVEQPIISFVDTTTFAGYAGCNRFIGNYQLTGEDISLKTVGVTKMLCQDDAMSVEDKYLTAISGDLKIELSSDETILTLKNPANDSKIVYTKSYTFEVIPTENDSAETNSEIIEE